MKERGNIPNKDGLKKASLGAYWPIGRILLEMGAQKERGLLLSIAITGGHSIS